MDKLLVALDVESAERAMHLVTALRGVAGGFKVGNRLFTSEGPALVRRIVDAGSRVFLDLKYHDIPNTVEQAVEAAVDTGELVAPGSGPPFIAATTIVGHQHQHLEGPRP